MERLLQLDRVFKALVIMLAFGLLAAFAYTGELSDVVGSKAHRMHIFIDVVVVGLLGRAGAAAMFLLLGIAAAVVTLRRGENA